MAQIDHVAEFDQPHLHDRDEAMSAREDFGLRMRRECVEDAVGRRRG
jgi:hypothetical protein